MILHSYTEEVYSTLVDCDLLLEKNSKSASMVKDMMMLSAIVMGLYSHSKTLVSRHIAHEKG